MCWLDSLNEDIATLVLNMTEALDLIKEQEMGRNIF